MRRFLFLVIILLCVSIIDSERNIEQPMNNTLPEIQDDGVALSESDEPERRTGYIHVDPAEYGMKEQVPVITESFAPMGPYPGTPPSAMFNLESLPPVGNQGSQGSCTGWSTGYYCFTHQVAKANNYWDVSTTDKQFSPAFIYNQINFGDDSGSHVPAALDLLSDFGCGTLAQMPYDQNDYITWPSYQTYLESATYRVADSGYFTLNDDIDLNILKEYLAGGNTAVLPIWVWSAFYGFDLDTNIYVIEHIGGGEPGGHAVCIVGYDDNLPTNDGPGAFRLVNSWGPGWGDNGFFWISYEAMKNPQITYGQVYWMEITEQPYYPKLLASVRLSHARRGHIMYDNIQIGLRDQGVPSWSKEFFDLQWTGMNDGTYQNHPFPGNQLVFDLSDAIPYLNEHYDNEFYIQVCDSVWPVEGILESFSIHYHDWDLYATSQDTPLTIPDNSTWVEATAFLEPPRVTINSVPSYVNNDVLFEGAASGSSVCTVLDVGFELGSTWNTWYSYDANPTSGDHRWMANTYRSKSGGTSLWCSGVPSSTSIYSEDFNMGSWSWPSGWNTYSDGSNFNPWTHTGSSGDYKLYCDTGGQDDVKEWVVQGPLDTSTATDLYLSFWMDYEVDNATEDDFMSVLYSINGTYFWYLEKWVAPVEETYTFEGTHTVHLPEDAINQTFYFAFIFQGDYRGSVTIDDIDLQDVIMEYANDIETYVSRPVDLSSFDSAVMSFDYWLDIEVDYDWFSPVYHNASGWTIPFSLDGQSDWQRMTMVIPTSADYIGFYFYSDSIYGFQGVFVDNVQVLGINNISEVAVFLDESYLGLATGVHAWEYDWDSTTVSDGTHEVLVSTWLRGVIAFDSDEFVVDNTSPRLESTTELFQNGDNITLEGYFNNVGGGSPLVSFVFSGGNISSYFTTLVGESEQVNSTTMYWRIFNISTIPDGVYEAELTMSDAAGNAHSVQFYVRVDNTAPDIQTVADFDISEGSTDDEINWDIDELYPHRFVLYRNETLVAEGGWTNSVLYELDGLNRGVYNFTLVVYDFAGNHATDTVFVTVIDDTNPTIDSPDDLEFSEGSTGNDLVWKPSDRHPSDFLIFINGSLFISASWDSEIKVSLDTLPMGVYNLTITVYDSSGNEVSDTVFVTVLDTTVPICSALADVEFYEGTTGHILLWTVYDLHPGEYLLFVNGITHASGIWEERESTFSLTLDDFSHGTYNVTLSVIDSSGNAASDTVIVNVLVSTTTTPSTTTEDWIMTMIPLILIIIGAVIVIVALVVLIIRSRK